MVLLLHILHNAILFLLYNILYLYNLNFPFELIYHHFYTRKKGLVWQEVFLPEFAPSAWKERGVLWNAVEWAQTSSRVWGSG